MTLNEQSAASFPVSQAVEWLLRIVVAVQCFAVAARRLDKGLETPIGGVLYFEWGWSELAMLRVEDAAAWAMAAAGVVTLLRPCWAVLLPVAVWMAMIPLAAWQRDDGFIPPLEPVSHGVRFAAPLCLALLAWWPPRLGPSRWRTGSAMWLLRLGVAATFIGHGVGALNHNPHFVDLILTAGDRLAEVSVTEDTARKALMVIGIMDIAVAVNLLLARLPAVALWMAIWGVVTASSRIIYYGFDSGYVETLIRIGNGGGPLVLACAWLLVSGRQVAALRRDAQLPPTEEPTSCESVTA